MERVRHIFPWQREKDGGKAAFSASQTAAPAAVQPVPVPVITDADGRAAGGVLPPKAERSDVIENDGSRVAYWKELSAYRAPGGDVPAFFREILSADGGVLISGTTGSGKSVLLSGIITTILKRYTPAEAELFLCDPKIVELHRFSATPLCKGYADTHDDIIALLQRVEAVMMSRYEEMRRRGIQKWDGARIFLVVDEIGDLMLTHKKTVLPLFTHLVNLCRAAGITVFFATQSPARATIPAALALNCTVKICLRCDTEIESKQAVGVPGGELLPRYGEALYRSPDSCGIKHIVLPYVTKDEEQAVLRAVVKADTATIRKCKIA